MTPPPAMFGCSVTSLALDLDYSASGESLKTVAKHQCELRSRSEVILEAIRSFRQLQDLKMWSVLHLPLHRRDVLAGSEVGRLRTLIPVLNSVQKLPALTHVTIAFNTLGIPGDRRCTYAIDRDRLLDHVVGSDEIVDVLKGFPALHHISFCLHENESLHHNEEWWVTEITGRLRGQLRATIAVRLHVDKSKSSSFQNG